MRRLAWLLVLAVLVMLPRPTSGQRDVASANERKALFIYNFLPFVRWPADAFHDPSETLRVQIIGRDPFDGSLDRLVVDRSVDNRRIVVTHSAVPTTVPFPHVALVSSTVGAQLASVLAAYCRAPVLTVSDLEHFADRGGVIGIVEDGQSLRFAINQTAASQAHLQVSSQLFHLAVPLFSAVSPCGAR
jgi:YfiR/HmsC-like